VNAFSGGDSFVAVELRSTNKMIGLIQIQRKDKINTEIVHDFGYVFNSVYHSKGYASESCQNILEYLFSDLKIDKVTAGTPIVNKSSCKLLGRLGFKEISRKTKHFNKDSEGNPIEFIAGLFELTSEEWTIQRIR